MKAVFESYEDEFDGWIQEELNKTQRFNSNGKIELIEKNVSEVKDGN